MEIQQTQCVSVCVFICLCVSVASCLPVLKRCMLKIKYINTYQTYKFLVLGRQLHLKKDKDFSKHPGLVLLKVNHETAGIQMKVLKSHSKNHSLGGDVQEH